MKVYCSKSTGERGWEGMRKWRSRRRAADILNIIQNEGDEDADIDISTTDQIPVDMANNSPVTMMDDSTSALDCESSSGSLINADGIADGEIRHAPKPKPLGFDSIGFDQYWI